MFHLAWVHCQYLCVFVFNRRWQLPGEEFILNYLAPVLNETTTLHTAASARIQHHSASFLECDFITPFQSPHKKTYLILTSLLTKDASFRKLTENRKWSWISGESDKPAGYVLLKVQLEVTIRNIQNKSSEWDYYRRVFMAFISCRRQTSTWCE